MRDPVLVSLFAVLFEKEYSVAEADSAEERWKVLKSTIRS